jgi:hypothetical protein
MMHGVRRFFRFAHVDGLIASDQAKESVTEAKR